jgi:murein DD-endopeptidase
MNAKSINAKSTDLIEHAQAKERTIPSGDLDGTSTSFARKAKVSMMSLNTKCQTLYMAIAFTFLTFGLPTCFANNLRESFDISVALTPTPVTVGHTKELVYELRLTNFSSDELKLHSLSILDGSSYKQLSAWSGRDLAKRFHLVGETDDSENPSMTVSPGKAAMIYIEYQCPVGNVPATLVHVVDYSVAGQQSQLIVRGGRISIQKEAPVELGPPLSGGPWVAVYSPERERGHRRVFYTVDGIAHLPGRFAMDFFRVDDEGKTTHGDPDQVQNALGYGVPVLAVADAQVVTVRDGFSENERVSQNHRHALGEAPGNYVVLRLDDQRFAVYEHLKPGSIRVSVGDRVHRGETIAALGFTGDSTGPHLHFNVADSPEPLNAEGLPFVFRRFKMIGQYSHIEDLGMRRWNSLAAMQLETEMREMPQPNAVLLF